uniref:N-acyl-aliphatic-L-amino acid amidohydrolase n=1 Tax=Graphocephala atropunctata TaxID=36148 RepID=A0A1B6M4R6_9HEMI
MPLHLDSQALENFKEYLRIPSVQPDCDYSGCVSFLKSQANRLKLPVYVYEVAPKKPVVILSWVGSRPELPSLLLSSHMDVVPVYEEMWTHAPFGAEQDERGNIYARGAQDMKCVAIQYLEAVYRLKTRGYSPIRSVHICFTPDEEIGSQGMRLFVETEAFRKLNVGCELDEGVASPDNDFNLYYGERTSFKIMIVCPGTPGHGSLLHENTAGEKLSVVIKRFMERRADEKRKLKENPELTLGDVTSINLTMIEGGVQANVVPPEMKVLFDCRVSLTTDHEEFEEWIRDVCKEAGEGVALVQTDKKKRIEPTSLDSGNPWWSVLNTQFEKMGLKVKPNIFPAATDARYIRNLGIPAFNFSPMNNTPVLLHDHDEFLNADVFLKGIEIYVNIISAMANLE